jgi:hypothetical protein
VKFDRGDSDRSIADQTRRFHSSETPFEYIERAAGRHSDPNPKFVWQTRGALDTEGEQRRVAYGEPAELQSGRDELVRRIASCSQVVDSCAQEIERSDSKRRDKALFGSVHAVDRACADADLGGDSSHGQCVDAVFLDSSLGGLQQCSGRSVVVLLGATHG